MIEVPCAVTSGPTRARIALRRIQKTCPPPRPACPVFLEVEQPIAWVGAPTVVPKSCMYGPKQ